MSSFLQSLKHMIAAVYASVNIVYINYEVHFVKKLLNINIFNEFSILLNEFKTCFRIFSHQPVDQLGG